MTRGGMIDILSDRRKLTGQSGSALGSTSIDNSSALLGRHSFQKPVVSGPFNSAGLKCSFHFNKFLIFI
jgi:hypothetical protein